MSFLTILIQDPPILELRETDSPDQLEVGSDLFMEIQSHAETGLFLGFYDWLRTSAGEIVGLRITFHDQRESAIGVLRHSHIGEWETPEIYRLMFPRVDGQVDETLSVDQEFSVSRIYSRADGRIALLLDMDGAELHHHAWTRAKSLFSQGVIVKGRVEQLHDFGAFLSIPGTEFPGVIVIASLSDPKRPLTVADFPQVGTHVRAVVIGHRDAGRQIALSLRKSDFKRFQLQRPQPSIQALLSLSIEFGNRHFDAKLIDVGNLEAELKNWLFDDRRAVWRLFSAGLISEREARDLLLQKIFDYYRLTLSRVIIKNATDDPAEDEPFDLVLFGHAARDAPPPPG